MSGDDPQDGRPRRRPDSEHPTELPVGRGTEGRGTEGGGTGGRGTATHAPVEQAGFDEGTASAFATTRRVSTGELRAMVRARHGEDAEHAVSLPPVSPEFLERLRKIRRQGMDTSGVPFGPYTVFGLIGRGGMAQIRLAAQSTPGGGVQLVVIKSLLPEHAGSHARRDLLVEEGRVSASLRHPNIVELFDAGEIDGIPYLAFELIDGLSLRDLTKLIDPARLPLSCVLDLGAQAAAGLAHAHAAKGPDGRPLNVVHRDVTPHNVLVTRGGRVKLVDFGIARFEGRGLETQHGQLRGKLGYMAPEQCRPGPVDGRADLFALSLSLTEAIAGRRVLPPTLMILQESESLIRDACADSHEAVPPAVVDLLVKMAAIDPAARPWPTDEVALTLRDLAERTPGPSLAEYGEQQIFNRLLPIDLPTITDDPTREVKRLGAATPAEMDEDAYSSTVRRLRPLAAAEVTPPTPDPRLAALDAPTEQAPAATAPSAPASEPAPEEPLTPELVADLLGGDGPTVPPPTGPWAKPMQSPLPPDLDPPDGPEDNPLLDVAPTRRVAPISQLPEASITEPEPARDPDPPANSTRWLVPLAVALAAAAAAAVAWLS